MKVLYDYLNDSSFLKKLAKLHIKTYFVQITVLNWEEEPIDKIEGKVISANINIDGQSSIRRTANLSIALEDKINDFSNVENLLSLNKKIVLQIGYKNTTKEYLNYEILWFPLGVYIIYSCSISESNSGHVASLQLQDKMCLLNGTAGGTIPAATDFHLKDTIDDNGQWVTVKPTIYQIIQQLVHHFGGEQLGKIIISDLDNQVKQAMQWTLDKPLYYIKEDNNSIYKTDLKEGETPTEIFTKGMDVGYILTDFVYPDELVSNAGSTVTEILDKILEVLGNYEYFYDLDGNFIFQEKKNFFNNAQSYYILAAKNKRNLVPDYIASVHDKLSAYLINMTAGSSVFEFEDGDLITSYSNTPQYGAIKNDFIVWGVRSNNDLKRPFRYHLAIDFEPILSKIKYKMYNYKEYPMDKYGVWEMLIIVGKSLQGFGNPSIDSLPSEEQLHEDKTIGKNYIGNFYWQNGKIITIAKSLDTGEWFWEDLGTECADVVPSDWRTQLLVQGAAAQIKGLEPNYYYQQLKTEWPKIYDIKNGKFYSQILDNPSKMDYFLDFINAGNAKIGELNVKNIGRRSSVTDKGETINCVFENWIPDVILIKKNQEDTASKRRDAQKRGQVFSQVEPQIYNNLAIGGKQYSAYEEIRQTLHQFTNYNNSITLQTVPLYFLEPNTRITVNNPNSDINGDYLINSMSFSLDNEGLLTINASKAVEKI